MGAFGPGREVWRPCTTVAHAGGCTPVRVSEIAEFGAQTGKLRVPESWACLSPKAASAYWVRKWK